jgi:hypothetical protein
MIPEQAVGDQLDDRVVSDCALHKMIATIALKSYSHLGVSITTLLR